MNKILSLEQMKLLISGILQKIPVVPKKLSEFENDLEQTPNPDWNQVDETQKDYIKNKPFYDEEVDNVIKTIVKKSSFTTEKNSYSDYYDCIIGMSNESNNFLYNNTSLGKLYLITYNGVDYYLNPQYSKTYMDLGIYLGNPDIFDSRYTDNGLPFFINTGSYGTIYFATRNSETFTISIYEIDAENKKKLISHPIAEKYIPDNIPKIQSASVGQILSVKVVDENGNPVEWEAVDNSNNEPFIVTVTQTDASYVSDKTYAEILEAYNKGQTIYAVKDDCIYYLNAVINNSFRFREYTVTNGSITSGQIMINQFMVMYATSDFTKDNIGNTYTYDGLNTQDKTLVGAINEIDKNIHGFHEEITDLHSDETQITLLIETDMLPSVCDSNRKILTDANGNILLRY